MESEEKKLYTTRNLGEAAILVTLKYFMNNIDYQAEGDNNKLVGYFSFEDSENLRKTIQLYYQGQLAVEPRLYSSTMRELKAQVNNFYKNPHN